MKNVIVDFSDIIFSHTIYSYRQNWNIFICVHICTHFLFVSSSEFLWKWNFQKFIMVQKSLKTYTQVFFSQCALSNKFLEISRMHIFQYFFTIKKSNFHSISYDCFASIPVSMCVCVVCLLICVICGLGVYTQGSWQDISQPIINGRHLWILP